MLSNLSSDVITNISSYILGEPKYMKFKYNNALKQIQKKCRPEIEDLRYYNDITTNEYQYVFFFFTVDPKYKTLDYGSTLTIRQTEMVKDFIKKSFLSYLQPDMKKIYPLMLKLMSKKMMENSTHMNWMIM